jgi:hypothetical protein
MRPYDENLLALPGGDLVIAGLQDLANGIVSENALLVSVAGPRLLGLGFVVPEIESQTESCEHRLYDMLELRLEKGAHAAYNALIGRIVSFANAYDLLHPRRLER